MSLQKLAVVVAVALASLNCGCASRELTQARLDGSEPQRLSFGDPKTIQAHFTSKVHSCWFSGSAPLLQGYRYDTAALINAADVPAEEANTPHIWIFTAESQTRPAFEVEFHSFNENTLISTRNLSLPPGLAARLKKDVETWMFGDRGCGSPGPILTAAERRIYDPHPTASVPASQMAAAPATTAHADAAAH